MKRLLNFLSVVIVLGTASNPVFAEESIDVVVTSVANTSGNGSIEACGTAIHKDSIRPLLVTLKHDESHYTALTTANDEWCILFKRWTFSGNFEVSASTLDGSSSTPPLKSTAVY